MMMMRRSAHKLVRNRIFFYLVRTYLFTKTKTLGKSSPVRRINSSRANRTLGDFVFCVALEAYAMLTRIQKSHTATANVFAATVHLNSPFIVGHGGRGNVASFSIGRNNIHDLLRNDVGSAYRTHLGLLRALLTCDDVATRFETAAPHLIPANTTALHFHPPQKRRKSRFGCRNTPRISTGLASESPRSTAQRRLTTSSNFVKLTTKTGGRFRFRRLGAFGATARIAVDGGENALRRETTMESCRIVGGFYEEET